MNLKQITVDNKIEWKVAAVRYLFFNEQIFHFSLACAGYFKEINC